ncbi:uncharacterized protein [Aegilops tauschii subsp. strangulata]|uniref:uncharacterized protein n=1 Tax=Aegilops tauschii subsp. strangulata TaxID=200361 RepID=UPI00098B3286
MRPRALYKTPALDRPTAHSSAPATPLLPPAAPFFLASDALPPSLRRSSKAFSPAAASPEQLRLPRRPGARVRPSGTFYTEIRSGGVRLGLGTFKTAREAARAYDAAAWRLSRPRSQMNFDDARTCQQAQDLAPPPRLVSDEDRHEHRRRQHRLIIAEADELAMPEWRQRYPQDVADKNAFWVERRVDRADRRRRKTLAILQCELGHASFFDNNDPRWDDAFLSTSDNTTEEEDDSE